MVSEVNVHGHLRSFFSGLVLRKNIITGRVDWNRATHFMVVKTLRERGPGARYTLQGHTPSDLHLPSKSHFLKFSLLPNSVTSWGSSLQYMSLWGDIPHPDFNSYRKCCQSFPEVILSSYILTCK